MRNKQATQDIPGMGNLVTDIDAARRGCEETGEKLIRDELIALAKHVKDDTSIGTVSGYPNRYVLSETAKLARAFLEADADRERLRGDYQLEYRRADRLREERDAARAEVEQLKAQWEAEFVRRGKALSKVEAERDAARTALEFYADEGNYFGDDGALIDGPKGYSWPDRGQRARDFLKKAQSGR